MKIEDILNALPTRDEILAALPTKEEFAHTIGLQARRSNGGDAFAAFAIFGTGLLLGAGLALLFAPKAGSELRQDLANRMGELGDEVAQKGRELGNRVSAAMPERSSPEAGR